MDHAFVAWDLSQRARFRRNRADFLDQLGSTKSAIAFRQEAREMMDKAKLHNELAELIEQMMDARGRGYPIDHYRDQERALRDRLDNKHQ